MPSVTGKLQNSNDYRPLESCFARSVIHLQKHLAKQQQYHEEFYEQLLVPIFDFYPMDILKQLFNEENQKKVVRYLQEELKRYPELDLKTGPHYVAKTIKNDLSSMDSEYIISKIKLILITKAIDGVCRFLNYSYEEGLHEFRKCLQFVYYLKNIPLQTNQKYINFIRQYELTISLYCGECIINYVKMKGNRWSKDECLKGQLDEVGILQSLLCGIVDNMDLLATTYRGVKDKYVLSQIFQQVGDIHEVIAILKGNYSEYEQEHSLNNFALSVDNEDIANMIPKYIISMTFKPSGDSSALYCLDKIIEGIVLYGEFQVEIIKFFVDLRLFYQQASL